MPTFFETFAASVERTGSRLCVGLDPHPGRLPTAELAAFNRAIIEATHDLACCYKPNIAFYEARGAAGMQALRETLAAIPSGTPVILDAKRGDIGSTAEAYAQALFDDLGVAAITINPYLGGDAVEPFLRRAERGVFIVCRTSNSGAGDLQDLPVTLPSGETLPLYLAVAERVRGWNSKGNAALVAGATYPRELAELRARFPELPMLVPGVGAQSGSLEEAARAADNGNLAGFVISASRAITEAAAPGEDAALAARAVALRLRDAINAALRVGTAG
jgi:orotidine-5'-phosphate decarboxylase